MKKLFFLTVMVTALFLQLACVSLMAQVTKQVWSENFNSSLPPSQWTANPTGSWKAETTIVPEYPSGNTQSFLGEVPFQTNTLSYLTTEYFPLINYPNLKYVYLKFSHICKLSTKDRAWIEYRVGMGGWNPIPVATYKGNPYSTYRVYGYFNSYR